MARGKSAATPIPVPVPAPAPEVTKARVLVTGIFGATDDVVELHPDLIAQGVMAGQLDPHPDAVAYAASLI
jgi:hypothetical protein